MKRIDVPSFMSSSSDGPPSHRREEKLLHGNPVSAHEQPPTWLEYLAKGRQASGNVATASAFNLDRGHRAAALDNEVDLLVALAPVVELTLASGGCVGEVSADARFHQPAPEFAVCAGLLHREARLRAHECGVHDLELGARSLLTDGTAGVLGEPGQEPGAAQQVQIV